MTAADPAGMDLEDLGRFVLELEDWRRDAYIDALDPEELEIIEAAISAAELAGADWRETPATMAQHLSGLIPGPDGRLRLWPYVKLLGQKFKDAVEGRSIRQIWNMPPRYGKSLIASRWGPAWALDRDPVYRMILVSYGDQLALENAVGCRDILNLYREYLRAQLRQDRRAARRFVTTAGGGILAGGIGSSLTGFGGHGAVFDDPFKNWQEAHSEARRNLVDNAFRSVVTSRLDYDDSWVIVPMCMTGDTLVLTSDGVEKPLRDVRPGDQLATYEAGRLATSKVLNWANQGPDIIYEVRMKSGRRVRANARHPFRVIQENGEATWVRVGSLRAGMKVRSVEAPIPASNVPSRDATTLRSARACACPTTARTDGRPDIDRLPHLTLDGVLSDSKDGTGSPLRSTTGSSPSRTAGAPSAANAPTRPAGRSTGPASFASTMTTTRERCEVCSATTAISLSGERTRSASSGQPLSTWRVSADEVAEVVGVGTADVFDIEVERTHNFIANGLEVSNTRWHEDDLTGRLVDRMQDHTGEEYEIVRIPELAETTQPDHHSMIYRLVDLLDRLPGEPIELERFTLEAITRKHLAAGCTPAETPILMADWTAKPISEVRAGDQVVGWVSGPGRKMRLQATAVEATSERPGTVYDYRMASGRTIRATRDHRWFTRGARGYRPANVGTPLRFVCPVVEDAPTADELGWWQAVAALFGGAGRTERHTDRVVDISRPTDEPVYALQTGTGNYIAWGYASSNSYLAAAMYQQRPAPEEGGEIKRAWFRLEDSMPPRYDDAASSWDMKLKDKESGDYVVGQAWGRTGKDLWLFDQLRGQWNQATTENAIVLLKVRHPELRVHYVENTGYGPEVIENLRKARPGYRVSDDIAGQLGMTDDERTKVSKLRQRGMNGVLPVTPKGDKRVRMRAVSGDIEAGDVHVPERAQWLGVYLDEIAGFPNGAHDDQVDATSQAISKMTKTQGSVKAARGDVGRPPINTRGGGTLGVTAAPRQVLPGPARAKVSRPGRLIIPRGVPRSGR